MKKLFLIPTPIHEDGILDISPRAIDSAFNLKFFIVENIKTARRFLRKMGFVSNFDTEVQFYEIDKHDQNQSSEQIRTWMSEGHDIGIMSEAGLPCIADPGSKYVSLAHTYDYRVVPLSGPSSIILALIASGFNGQNFTFHGYLPINKSERLQKIKSIESHLSLENQTQIFMETPYRNLSLYEDILKTCHANTHLSICADIGSESEFIRSEKIQNWQKIPVPAIHKKPTIFLLGRSTL